MNIIEIGKLFSERVNEYMSKGYGFSINTMSGLQGETAKVDLTDGKDFIRVYVERHYFSTGNTINIVVGRAKNVNFRDSYEFVWKESLEIISEDVFYEIGSKGDYYGTKEEAVTASNKRYQRRLARCKNNDFVVFDSKEIRKRFLPYAQEHIWGCKSAKLSDVSVYKENRFGHYVYYVGCRGRSCRLS